MRERPASNALCRRGGCAEWLPGARGCCIEKCDFMEARIHDLTPNVLVCRRNGESCPDSKTGRGLWRGLGWAPARRYGLNYACERDWVPQRAWRCLKSPLTREGEKRPSGQRGLKWGSSVRSAASPHTLFRQFPTKLTPDVLEPSLRVAKVLWLKPLPSFMIGSRGPTAHAIFRDR